MVVVIIKIEQSKFWRVQQMAVCPFPKLLILIDGFSFHVESVEYSVLFHQVTCWVTNEDNVKPSVLKKSGWTLGV